jgi:hypothetical protein
MYPYCAFHAYQLDSNIEYVKSAEMITTGIAVGTDGSVVLGAGATFGILVAILFLHGIVCSAATRILARLSMFYVMINGKHAFFLLL